MKLECRLYGHQWGEWYSSWDPGTNVTTWVRICQDCGKAQLRPSTRTA